jgi:hypothetical protein
VSLTGCTASPLLLNRSSPPPMEPYYSSSTDIVKLASSFWGEKWSERGDLNSRPPVPQTGALTELRYAPTLKIKHLGTVPASTNQELPPVCRPRCRISASLACPTRQRLG